MPTQPKLYHITHIDNLPSILASGKLWSDAIMIAQGGPSASIGMSSIKQRRLRLPVKCHPGDYVGEYVPFYFCPRSIMLYLLFRGNHPDLNYTGGQTPILHLEADLSAVVQWAEGADQRWAFTLSNAGAAYTEFRSHLDQLNEINWSAVASSNFRDAVIKEGKQSEFLVRDFFPWGLVQRIGVYSTTTYQQVMRVLSGFPHPLRVEIRNEWYF